MDNYLQESYPQRVLHAMSAAVLVLDRKGRIMYLNRPAADMLELDDTCPPGTQRFQLTSDNTENDEFYEYIFAALYQKQETHVGQVKYRSPSGKLYHVRISSSYLSTQDIENSEIVLTISDEMQEFMLQQKVHDSATTFTTFLFGFVFMIGAAILAGLEGILYEKQQNIVGVWIVHWAFGVCATLLCLIDH